MRKLARVTATVALIAAGFLATACQHSQTEAPKPAPTTTLKTADYNDGWVDGQADVADELGHRLPNDTEYGLWVAADKQSGKCHLEWDGPAVQAYEVICTR